MHFLFIEFAFYHVVFTLSHRILMIASEMDYSNFYDLSTFSSTHPPHFDFPSYTMYTIHTMYTMYTIHIRHSNPYISDHESMIISSNHPTTPLFV